MGAGGNFNFFPILLSAEKFESSTDAHVCNQTKSVYLQKSDMMNTHVSKEILNVNDCIYIYIQVKTQIRDELRENLLQCLLFFIFHGIYIYIYIYCMFIERVSNHSVSISDYL